MPVYRLHTETCVGFVDILDILAFIVKRLRELGPVDPLVALRTWHQLEYFTVTPVSELINASGRDPYATVSMVRLFCFDTCITRTHLSGLLQETHLDQVVNVMIEKQVHRVGVLDHKGKVYNILTQTRLLDFVLANEDKNVPFSLGPMDRDEVAHFFPSK